MTNLISSPKTGRAIIGSTSSQATLNSEKLVAFASDSLYFSAFASGLNEIYLKNTITGDLTLVSSNNLDELANANSNNPSMSADGRYVVFQSSASNLVGNGIDVVNNKLNVFLKDTQTNAVNLVSSLIVGNNQIVGSNESLNAKISADGQFVVFQSMASNFVGLSVNDTPDINGTYDIYLKNLHSGELTLVSANKKGDPGNHASYEPTLSANGSLVAFSSDADNFLGLLVEPAIKNKKGVMFYNQIDSNMSRDVFVKNVNTGTLKLVSVNIYGKVANGTSDSPSLSAEGTKVAFRSSATNLIPNFEHTSLDKSVGLYVKDLSANTITLVNSVTDTQGLHYANGESWQPTMSPDGKYVAFISHATNLVARDTNDDVADVFVKNLSTNEITRIAETDEAKGDVVDFAFSNNSLKVAVTRSISLDFAAQGLTDIYLSDTVQPVIFKSGGGRIQNLSPNTLTADRWTGTVNADSVFGNGGNDILLGLGGNDLLDGGDGDDKLDGAAGIDNLTGGAGKDIFVFNKGDSNIYYDFADSITDLAKGDKIDLSGISKHFHFIKTIGADFGGSNLKLSSTEKDAYVLNFDGKAYLVYETTTDGSATEHEIIAIGSVIPGALTHWTMTAGILTIA